MFQKGSLLPILAAILVPTLAVFVLWPPGSGARPEHDAAKAGKTVITYWDRHLGHEHEMRRALIDEFNATNNNIHVRVLSIGERIEKVLTAISSGAPPDACGIDSNNMFLLAAQGGFMPLDDFARASGIWEDTFFPSCWRMVHFEGHLWALPVTTDIYALLWNKDIFREAGLDPEQPPRTIEELDAFADKLTKFGPNGELERMGFLPWSPWDMTFHWGIAFGGRWYDPETDQFTIAEDPHILESIRWQASYGKRYDPTKVEGFRLGLGQYMSANNPFYVGKVAMALEGEWQETFIPRYAPDLDWGVAPIPQPAHLKEERAVVPSSVTDVIPAGSPHPQEAWEFISWMFKKRASDGTYPLADYNEAIHNIPPMKVVAQEPRFSEAPNFRAFVDLFLTRTGYSVPPIPVAPMFLEMIEKERQYVVFGLKTPEQAVEHLDSFLQNELDEVREWQRRSL